MEKKEELLETVIEKEKCNGCRACELSCPMQCIKMVLDEEGFLYPVIERDKCINCGKCRAICHNNHFKVNSFDVERKVYAAWNKNSEILEKSSSGGIFYALAKYVIGLGGIVYGAAFAEEYFVEQKRIDKEKDIPLLMGSKYVQSDTKETYKQVYEDLKDNRIVLYSGTPCQIKGLNNYLECSFQNLFCVSIVCHGVPSPIAWHKYLQLKKGQYAENIIHNISFRNKTYGWNNFSICIEFEKRKYLEEHNSDIYMKGFLQNLFLRPSCYKCTVKTEMVYADIVLGDYWGIEKEIPELNEDTGISSVIINTKKGYELWKGIEGCIYYRESTYESVKKYNSAIDDSVMFNVKRKDFFEELEIGGIIEEAIKDNLHMDKIAEIDRFSCQYPILYKYLLQELSGNNLVQILEKIGLKKIALYSITDMLDAVLLDISREQRFTIYISDRNFKKYGEAYKGYRIVSLPELKKMREEKELDGIIICNPLRENDIFKEFLMQGIKLDIIYSIISLIYN